MIEAEGQDLALARTEEEQQLVWDQFMVLHPQRAGQLQRALVVAWRVAPDLIVGGDIDDEQAVVEHDVGEVLEHHRGGLELVDGGGEGHRLAGTQADVDHFQGTLVGTDQHELAGRDRGGQRDAAEIGLPQRSARELDGGLRMP